jgi:predicted PurR-regulated permease PerM
MDASSLLERYITILLVPVIGLAIVLLPFIVFALYTWWSQRRR